jgi:osmotically-inducible protein OsmY
MNAATRNSIIGAGIGAGLVFLLDPTRGNRRRALIRDKVVKASRKTFDAAAATRRDVANRLQGVRARAGNMLSGASIDDAVMVERVRAKLGRVASHPRAIDVYACNGCITLTGDVLASEVVSIMSTIAGMRGVVDVENQMQTHATPTHVPSLQGQSERSSSLKSGWSPAAMLACGLTAAAALGGTALMRGRKAM